MLKLTVVRLLQMIPLVLVSSMLVFLLIHLAPGDPAYTILGPDAEPEHLEALRAEWGLDKPLPVQYATWMNRVLHGDVGKSYRSGFQVLKLIKLSMPATMELTVVAFVLSLLIGFPTGILAALRERSRVDFAITAFQTLFVGIPTFWLGLLLILVFSLYLGWLPPSSRPTGFLRNPSLAWKFLLLPALCLALRQGAVLSRFVKASLLETLRQDYIRTARAKGLRERVVIVQHALRNALIPVVTVMGLNIARLLSGAVVVETVFAWPGLGQLVISAIGDRDYTVVQGTLLLTMVVVMFVNLFVDMAYAIVDPRIRL